MAPFPGCVIDPFLSGEKKCNIFSINYITGRREINDFTVDVTGQNTQNLLL